MKISSGWSKGLKILTPDGLDTRPTRERVRQSALNMLQPWIHEAKILDLFAGSGAVGIELVSRGASGGVFVEKAPPAFKCLEANLRAAGERARIQGLTLVPWQAQRQDVRDYMRAMDGSSFDLIWADPPYESVPEFLDGCSGLVERALNSGGVFALESGVEPGVILAGIFSGDSMKLVKQRTYGVTLISIWQKV